MVNPKQSVVREEMEELFKILLDDSSYKKMSTRTYYYITFCPPEWAKYTPTHFLSMCTVALSLHVAST
jgi:hypothetical protein